MIDQLATSSLNLTRCFLFHNQQPGSFCGWEIFLFHFSFFTAGLLAVLHESIMLSSLLLALDVSHIQNAKLILD